MIQLSNRIWKVRLKSSVGAGFGRHGMPRPPLTLTYDRLTLKLIWESHLRWGTFLPNLGTLCFCVLELFAMYATNGQMDRRTNKSNAYCPLPCGRGRNKLNPSCLIVDHRAAKQIFEWGTNSMKNREQGQGSAWWMERREEEPHRAWISR